MVGHDIIVLLGTTWIAFNWQSRLKKAGIELVVSGY
jgi:hypothetical protein